MTSHACFEVCSDWFTAQRHLTERLRAEYRMQLLLVVYIQMFTEASHLSADRQRQVQPQMDQNAFLQM